jgi:hypothetical protein
VDCELAVRLVRRGFTATTAQAQGMIGATDSQHLAFANQHQWAILTHNRRHFQREHQTYLRLGLPHSGILILPQRGGLDRLELRAVMMLDWISTYALEIRSSLFTWTDLQLRLTQGLRLPRDSPADVREALGQRP